jgi:hypothetical protein
MLTAPALELEFAIAAVETDSAAHAQSLSRTLVVHRAPWRVGYRDQVRIADLQSGRKAMFLRDQPMCSRIASYWAGSLNIEIIEPVSGYVEPYVNMLPADRKDAVPRFHHISLRRDNEAEMRQEIARLGLPIAFEGPLSIKVAIPSLVFIYLDGRESLGHYVEYTWKSPEGWKFVGWPEGRPIY